MCGWRETTMAEMVRFRNGKSTKGIAAGNIPVYGSNGIIGTSAKSLYSNAIILGRVGAYCGSVAYCSRSFWATDNTIVVEPNADVLDVVFGYYLFLAADLNRYASGSAQPLLTQTNLKGVSFSLPPLKIQRRIAEILGAYDDLIEVNRQRISVLESMVQGLFTEWFIRLRFPGHEDVAIENTPDGPLPAGWTYDTLANIASINATSLRANSAPTEIGYIDIASVSPGRIDAINRMLFSDAPGRARRRVRDGSILWSNVRPNRRSFALVLDPTPDIIASTGFTVLDPHGTSFAYLYQWVTTEKFVSYLVGNAQGAAYPAVTSATFERAMVLLPPSDQVARYTAFAEPLLRLADHLQKSNTNLAAARGLLLPRLISGQLSITQAERELEVA